MSIIRLPVEVLDIALLCLTELDAARCLRLANRELATTVSATSMFKSYFLNKTIDVDNRGHLESLEKLTQPGQLGCLLQYLSLTSNNTPLPDDVCVEYLSRSLINLQRHSKHCCPKMLTLQTESRGLDAAEETPDWRQTWSQVGHTFSVAMEALGESGITIGSLDMFGESARSGLACNLVAQKLHVLKPANSFGLLTSLTLSISHHIAQHPETCMLQSAPSGRQNAQAVASFVQMAPSLTDLHLHWYSLYTSALSEAMMEERGTFNHIAHSCPFPALTKCTLRGVYTDEACLLEFLQKANRLANLTFEEVHLENGTFRPVFEYLVPRLDLLQLRDLYEGQELIHFEAPGQPPSPTPSRRDGPTSLTRDGDVARRKPIRYRVQQGRPLGSSRFLIWKREKQAQSGPP